MTRIIRAADLVPAPWKNGGGITREISSHSTNGGVHWRLSVADVDRDGPFSSFPGLSRILTVIEGHGMSLHASGETLHALPLQPLAFAGDLPVDGHLNDGPVRNFNLIFDPQHVNPSVEVHRGPQTRTLPQAEHAVHCLTGTAVLNEIALHPGNTALINGGDMRLTDQTQIICVTL
ncbi:HutD family protein [Tropicibacter sp. Alg240-R139]|uniref:HutD/Ves family protein n=1 Tax=Tropicibacter sp. Alg240-R139 TaxID=2305991 RepID=UPI0013DF776C|nr:HutD family protein [Tropicibacter sp. Alg240-R139]